MATVGAGNNDALDRVVPAEEPGRLCHAAGADEVPDQGTAHHHAVRLNGFNHAHLESAGQPHFLKEVYASFPSPAEGIVVAYVHFPGADLFVKDIPGKGLRVLACKSAGEARADNDLNARGLEQPHLPVECVQKLRRALGSHYFERMGLKGKGDARAVDRPRPLHDLPEYRLMPQVYAVEIPDRQHGIRKCFRQIFYTPDDPHIRR